MCHVWCVVCHVWCLWNDLESSIMKKNSFVMASACKNGYAANVFHFCTSPLKACEEILCCSLFKFMLMCVEQKKRRRKKNSWSNEQKFSFPVPYKLNQNVIEWMRVENGVELSGNCSHSLMVWCVDDTNGGCVGIIGQCMLDIYPLRVMV